MKCLEIENRELEHIKREWEILKEIGSFEKYSPFIATLLKDITGELDSKKRRGEWN